MRVEQPDLSLNYALHVQQEGAAFTALSTGATDSKQTQVAEDAAQGSIIGRDAHDRDRLAQA